MTPLAAELREIIETEGPISLERYMTLCLQHPRHGYYTTRDPIGRGGDFVTAPEVDQMFGELIGLWIAQVWLTMGRPNPVRLVELGPGRGTLAADALRAMQVVPELADSLCLELVETSPFLRAVQKARLEEACQDIAWYASCDDLPDGPAIIVANEFFDALPVRHYLRGDAGWHERLVGVNREGALAFGMAAEPVEIAAGSGGHGQILEVGHAALRVVDGLARRIGTRGGALLICDYGHAETGFGETLQAVRGHAYADVLSAPGEADLTAHVDFAALRRAAETAGAAVHGPLAQGVFLQRLGIAQRAVALKAKASARQAALLDAALDRFTGPASSMATLFKVLAVTPHDAPVPPGFDDRG